MTQLVEPVGCKVDLQTGAMSQATGAYQKYSRDLEGLYADASMREGWKQVDNTGWRMRDAATSADPYGHQKKEEAA